MKKVVVLLVFAVVLLVGDKSGIELPSAVELYKKACDGGDLDGCRNLVVMHTNGNGVEKD